MLDNCSITIRGNHTLIQCYSVMPRVQDFCSFTFGVVYKLVQHGAIHGDTVKNLADFFSALYSHLGF